MFCFSSLFTLSQPPLISFADCVRPCTRVTFLWFRALICGDLSVTPVIFQARSESSAWFVFVRGDWADRCVTEMKVKTESERGWKFVNPASAYDNSWDWIVCNILRVPFWMNLYVCEHACVCIYYRTQRESCRRPASVCILVYRHVSTTMPLDVFSAAWSSLVVPGQLAGSKRAKVIRDLCPAPDRPPLSARNTLKLPCFHLALPRFLYPCATARATC